MKHDKGAAQRATATTLLPALLRRQQAAWHGLAALLNKAKAPSMQLFAGTSPEPDGRAEHGQDTGAVPSHLLAARRNVMD